MSLLLLLRKRNESDEVAIRLMLVESGEVSLSVPLADSMIVDAQVQLVEQICGETILSLPVREMLSGENVSLPVMVADGMPDLCTVHVMDTCALSDEYVVSIPVAEELSDEAAAVWVTYSVPLSEELSGPAPEAILTTMIMDAVTANDLATISIPVIHSTGWRQINIRSFEPMAEEHVVPTRFMDELLPGEVVIQLSISEEMSHDAEVVVSIPIIEPMRDPGGVYAMDAIPTPAGKPGYPDTRKWEIYLDGMRIRHRITGMEITCNDGYTHNQLSFSSSDIDLYDVCDPDVRRGDPRVEVQIGSRVFLFCIYSREISGENSFSVKAESLSATLNDEYNPGWEPPAIAGRVSATEYMAQVAGGIPFTMEIPVPGWTIPETSTLEGAPIDIMQTIAGVVKGVLRSQDGIGIRLRRAWPVRPVDMATAQPVLIYERSGIEAPSISVQVEAGSGENAVEVSNAEAGSVDSPDMEVEESSPVVGDTVHIRVFWSGGVQPESIRGLSTAGKLTYLGKKTIDWPVQETPGETTWEQVEFKDGTASLQKPATAVRQFRWVGKAPDGQVQATPFGKELTLSTGVGYGIAKVVYQTTYHRYRLQGVTVEAAMAILEYGSPESGVSLLVRTRDPVIEADPISDAMIPSERVAVERGMAEIDAMKYDVLKVAFRAPYRDEAVDGAIVYLDEPNVRCVGNFKITKADIAFNGVEIWNNLEMERCLIA